ncbi:MAG: hypothetical protein HYZ68_04860 [Chloroflexi bacterium]|nr:hypothetical protein [Chloroflexota bacterium]
MHTSEPLVPARLDLLGYGYTGSGYWTLATAQDKALTKALLKGYEIPTLRGRIYDQEDAGDWSIFPAIVKASRQHASEAITPQAVVTSAEELRSRLKHVIDIYQEPALVEEFVTGREFRVCILNGHPPSILPLVELDYSQLPDPLERLATYEAKFVPGSRHHEAIDVLCPAEVDPALEAHIQSVALRAYRALRCQDYGRVDVRVRNGVPYVLDVNPNPDITLETSFDYASEEAGMDYPALVDRIVQSALRRQPPDARIR